MMSAISRAIVTRKRIEKNIAALISCFVLRSTFDLRCEESTSEVIRSVMPIMANNTLKSPRFKGSITPSWAPFLLLYDI